MKKSLFFVILLTFSLAKAQNYNDFIHAAQAGDPIAQYNVGVCYSQGLGCIESPTLAKIWFIKSANNGNVGAMKYLGQCAEANEEWDSAMSWYIKAAQKGDKDAMCGIARIYFHCNLLKIPGIDNVDETVLYQWLSSVNCPEAYYALGAYEAEILLNKESARVNFTKAANLGYAEAQCELGVTLFSEGDKENGKKWLMKAVEKGNTMAQRKLASILIDEGDFNNAIPLLKAVYLRKGIGEEYFYSALNLAICYWKKGEKRTANRYLNDAVAWSKNKRNISPQYYDDLGEVCSLIGRKEDMNDAYDQLRRYASRERLLEVCPWTKDVTEDMSDVDEDIPWNKPNKNNTFVVVIANEEYASVEHVPFAMMDGEVFSDYCHITLGISEDHIHLVKNATLNQMNREMAWLSQVLQAYNGEAEVIFYYAGHGIPDEVKRDAYLLPIDGIGNDVSTGFQVSTLYQSLGSLPARQITIFMDACFSGTKRDGGMLVSARGVAIKTNPNTPQGNMVVFSAAQEDETAYPYAEQGHGMFTYFLLKKLKESGGSANLLELGNYIKSNVSQQSLISNGKSQTPSIATSPSVGDSWKTWSLR